MGNDILGRTCQFDALGSGPILNHCQLQLPDRVCDIQNFFLQKTQLLNTEYAIEVGEVVFQQLLILRFTEFPAIA